MLFLPPFILQSLLLIFIIKIPKILLLSLSDLTLVSDREGIDNRFITLVARFLFVSVGTRDLRVVSYWIDTLVLKNWGKYLRYFTVSSSPLRGNPTQCSRGSSRLWNNCSFGFTIVAFPMSTFWRWWCTVSCTGLRRPAKTCMWRETSERQRNGTLYIY